MADCPRCRLGLQSEEYEGAKVLFCGNCWGHWVTFEALAMIMASDQYQFSESEAATCLFGKWADANEEDPQPLDAALCPDCQQEMTTGPFSADCPIEVDRCARHGMWLDTSEVKQLQVYFES